MKLPRDEAVLAALVHVASCPDCQLHMMALALLMEVEDAAMAQALVAEAEDYLEDHDG